MGKAETLKTSKNSLRNRIFKDLQLLIHFLVSSHVDLTLCAHVKCRKRPMKSTFIVMKESLSLGGLECD